MSKKPSESDEQTQLLMDRPDTAHLRRIAGSRMDRFNDMIVRQVLATQHEPRWMTHDDLTKQREATLLAMVAFKPQDEIEAMFAGQALALHAMTMELSRRALLADQPSEIAAGMRKGAVQASRAFVEVTEALERRRGKGRKQSITVKHMHVSGDARAVIGNFGAGGGGDEKRIEGEPHAPPARLAHDAAAGAVLPPVRRANQERDAMPVARSAGEG